MNFEEVAPIVCRKTGMYVSPATFESVCILFDGMNMALDGAPLLGFREWLVIKFEDGDNLHWYKLAEWAIGFTPENRATMDHKAALLRLESLMKEFFEYRRTYGVVVIYDDYRRWLLRHKWYNGPLRKIKKAAKK